MRVAIPGKMQDFTKIKPGDFFSYFSEGTQHWGMLSRTRDGAEIAPISFTEPIQKGLPTPVVHDKSRFVNRSVFVIEVAEARAIWSQTFKDGSPPSDGIGSLIVADNLTMVRVKGSSGSWDIDVTNGIAQAAKAHPGSLTIPKWEIGFVQDGIFTPILQFPK